MFGSDLFLLTAACLVWCDLEKRKQTFKWKYWFFSFEYSSGFIGPSVCECVCASQMSFPSGRYPGITTLYTTLYLLQALWCYVFGDKWRLFFCFNHPVKTAVRFSLLITVKKNYVIVCNRKWQVVELPYHVVLNIKKIINFILF